MNKVTFSCVLLALIAQFIGCQASYRVAASSLPKTLAHLQNLDLVDANGRTENVSELSARYQATVLIFFQSACPCVSRYQSRISRLHKDYTPQGVHFVYVSSNSNESFKNALETSKKRSITIPIVRDEGGILAQAVGAKGTPTTAVINSAGQLVFLGWIDNERFENESGRIPYLENALREVLAQSPVTTATSPMFGCAIR